MFFKDDALGLRIKAIDFDSARKPGTRLTSKLFTYR